MFQLLSALGRIITSHDISKFDFGILNHSITDHLPIFAVLKNNDNKAPHVRNKNVGKTWQKIDDRKKDIFLSNLKDSLCKIDLNCDPESILSDLIGRTKESIDQCFPPKSLSNRALKRAEQPWIDKEINKEEKIQSKLFRKFLNTMNPAALPHVCVAV